MSKTTQIRDQMRTMIANDLAPLLGADVPIEVQRGTLDALGSQAEIPTGVLVERDTFGGVAVERLTPLSRAERVVIYVHGGGYCSGSCDSHRALAARVATVCRAQCIVPEYRLAPEHPFPAGLQDLMAVYRALLRQGTAASQIIFAGDSAGCALMVSMALLAKDTHLPQPRAIVMLSPWLDPTLSGPTMTSLADVDPWITAAGCELMVRAYGANPELALASPLKADLRGLPPILIHVGGQEILLSDSTRFEQRARAAGVDVRVDIYEDLWHVWHFFAPALPDANQALEAIGEHVEAWFGDATVPAADFDPRPRLANG
ncbi:6-hexanolactone hydrolase [Enhygromyxa salina]|uniref:6-hexanolactone hydrolase n=1 Tax=Enhygromyxa salina TaxID=215803 RepID=A0A0C1ZA18_9BACT|nr:alpha/beta hydrolase [Enhygromyxa salina]KIG14449.1 6-hexanolactone hydrolase [Enhygromyxa salina]